MRHPVSTCGAPGAAPASLDPPGRLRGCVPSTVTLGGGRRLPDRNGFVTALAARALRRRGLPVPPAMLDVLAACRSTAGGFRFWPIGARPAWAPELPDDADDTGIMTLELLHAGRLDRAEARRIACLTIGRHRVRSFGPRPSGWRRAGVFATWHRPGSEADLIDCTATANALALFAALGLWHLSGVDAAAAMLADAVGWAGGDAERARSLSPFYPEPGELVDALAHAVESGAAPLGEVLAAARQAPWGRPDDDPEGARAICSSPYGAVLWHAPALAGFRRRRGEPRPGPQAGLSTGRDGASAGGSHLDSVRNSCDASSGFVT